MNKIGAVEPLGDDRKPIAKLPRDPQAENTRVVTPDPLGGD